MMLVRLDADSSTINVLSVPRDLQVTIDGGTEKLNAAYSLGGTPLLIKTLQQQVFPGLVVNHVVDVNFGGFEKLVDAIGCVYGDVDHRYYNNTAYSDYSSINIQPGYQKLCNSDALAFVRFRHTDSDIVRNARQQDFIRWAKDQYSVGQLISNRDQLLKIFGANVQTDHSLHTSDGLINLFSLVLNSDGHEIKQVPFPAQFSVCNSAGTTTGAAQTPCYVTAVPSAEQHAFASFMAPTVPSPTGSAAGHAHKPAPVSDAGLIADVADGHGQAVALGHVPFSIYYPKLIANAGEDSGYCSSVTGNCDDPAEPASKYAGDYPRAYHIHGQHGGVYPSYVMTLVINSALGEYYTVQGTTWKDPPILLHGITGTRTVNGKVLDLYQNGAHISLVAWRTPTAVYWISNTLTDNLSNSQMIGIAASLTPAG